MQVSFSIDMLQSGLKPADEGAPACVPHARRVPAGTGAQLQQRESKGSLAASGAELCVVFFCFVLFSENPQCNSILKLPDDYQKFKIYAICLLGVLHNISFRFQSVER